MSADEQRDRIDQSLEIGNSGGRRSREEGAGTVFFRVLGPVEVEVSGQNPIQLVGKAAAVTAALALAAPRPLEKESLLAIAWGDVARDINVVESTIRTVRKKVGLPATQGIVTVGSTYRMDASTDLEKFSQLGKQADALANAERHEQAAEQYAAALRLWRARFPRELYENEEIRPYVDAFEHARREVQLKHLRTLWEVADWGVLLGHAEQLLAEDPFWEEALELKIKALYSRQGTRTAGAACREAIEMLRKEGIEPSQRILELQRQVLTNVLAHGGSGPGSATAGSAPGGRDLHEHAQRLAVETPDVDTRTPTQPDGHTSARRKEPARSVAENLPPATYAQFIMRSQLWARLTEAMCGRLPIITLTGIGGTGKSALAREFASEQKNSADGLFDSIIWISDRERPGTTTLSKVLDLVAYVTDHRGFAALDHNLKLFEVTKIMRQTACLLILDNYETIDDEELADWLRTVPEPSKVLITTIVRPRRLAAYSADIEVSGLSEAEGAAFYAQALRRLNLTDMFDDTESRDALLTVSNSNPRLIEWALGQAKRRGRSVRNLVEQISGYEGIEGLGDRRRVDVVLQDLLRSSWTSMSETARLVLAVTACFPYGVCSDAIDEICGKPQGFEDALEELCDLYFVTRLTYPGQDGPWYRSEPLVANRLGPDNPLVQKVRATWLRWCESLVAQVGFCPGETEKLLILDAPGLRLNIEYALAWAMQNARYDSVIAIARDARYYYYVRGFWSSSPNVHLVRAEAARKSNNLEAEFDALVYYLNIAAKQENKASAEQVIRRLEELLAAGQQFDPRLVAEYRHAHSLYLLAEGRLEEAAAGWRTNLKHPEILGPENHNANVRWLAICLSRQRSSGRSEAMKLFEWAREHARQNNYKRAEILIDLQIVELCLPNAATESELERVGADLEGLEEAVRNVADRRYEADLRRLKGTFLRRRGDDAGASAEFSHAADIYDRLGLAQQAANMRAECAV